MVIVHFYSQHTQCYMLLLVSFFSNTQQRNMVRNNRILVCGVGKLLGKHAEILMAAEISSLVLVKSFQQRCRHVYRRLFTT